jgi:hypothetical protein
MDRDQTPMSLPPATERDRKYHAILKEHAKRAIRSAGMKAAVAVQQTAQVLKIMVSLHSAKDFPSVLRLYGLEGSTGTE